MPKRVVKVAITGYYLIDENLPDDVLGMASIEEYIQAGIDSVNKGEYSAVDVAQWIEQDMSTRPTIKLELKPIEPDRNCYTLSDGSCVSTRKCMHTIE